MQAFQLGADKPLRRRSFQIVDDDNANFAFIFQLQFMIGIDCRFPGFRRTQQNGQTIAVFELLSFIRAAGTDFLSDFFRQRLNQIDVSAGLFLPKIINITDKIGKKQVKRLFFGDFLRRNDFRRNKRIADDDGIRILATEFAHKQQRLMSKVLKRCQIVSDRNESYFPSRLLSDLFAKLFGSDAASGIVFSVVNRFRMFQTLESITV